MVPFFDFSICLRVLDAGQDVFDLVLRQELAESTLRFPILVCLVGKKLRAMIGDHLFDHPDLPVIFKRLSNKIDTVIGSCILKFSASKNESGAIVENYTDLFTIESTGVPIKMNCSEAMFSLISDPGLPAFLLLFFLIGQAVLKKDMMDCIMRYVFAIFLLDDLLDAPCSGILLFVDFQD